MNTAISSSVTVSASRRNDEQRHWDQLIVQAWRQAFAQGPVSSAQLAAYACLRGRDPAKGFSPLVRPGKITSANGSPWQARDQALTQVSGFSKHALAPWGHLLKDEASKWGCYTPADPASHPFFSRLLSASAK